MSTTQELLAANERYYALVGRIEALASVADYDPRYATSDGAAGFDRFIEDILSALRGTA